MPGAGMPAATRARCTSRELAQSTGGRGAWGASQPLQRLRQSPGFGRGIYALEQSGAYGHLAQRASPRTTALHTAAEARLATSGSDRCFWDARVRSTTRRSSGLRLAPTLHSGAISRPRCSALPTSSSARMKSGESHGGDLARELDTEQVLDLIFTVRTYETLALMMRSVGLQPDDELRRFYG